MANTNQDGTVFQSGVGFNEGFYANNRLFHHFLGVILQVYQSDHPLNRGGVQNASQRSPHWEAEVFILNDTLDSSFRIPNVVIPPQGASGVDNYHEELPRGCSIMQDGSQYRSNLGGIDPEKLDGDMCVVGFIGGSIDQPYMICWWPHHGNLLDSATAGFPVTDGTSGELKDSKVLNQGRRLFKRYQGAKLTITDKGSLFIDTNESGSSMESSNNQFTRKTNDEGGDIQVDVKKNRKFEINFNPIVPLPKSEPSLSQKNPPDSGNDGTRSDDQTAVNLTQDQISLIAGKVVEILAKTEGISVKGQKQIAIEVSGSENITIKVNGGNVLIGDDSGLNPIENGVVLGGGIDPYTGVKYSALGNASTIVMAKKA